ncbi:MAG: SDR family NAD(P)-dependent oxidoreductase [Acholeplasmataceae bacterium]
MKRFENKGVIVTGGSGSIGKETVKSFLDEGASVLAVDLFDDALKELKKELASYGDALHTCQADVSKEEDVERFVSMASEVLASIDVLVNNAGVEGKVKPIEDQALEDYDKVMNINVRGIFMTLQRIMPIMKAQKSGAIVNLSSVAGLSGSAGVSPYVTSKHALVGLTKTAALEGAPYGVRVNSVHPSPIDNRMMRSLEEGFNPDDASGVKAELEASIPLGRYGTDRDVANVILFLASDDSQFITGAQYRVDGGMGAK